MDISLNSRLRRTEPLIRQDGTTKDAAAETAASGTQPQTDRLTLSRQTIEQLEEQSRRLKVLLERDWQEKEKKPAIWDIMGESEEEGTSEADILGEELKTMRKCQKIAARIMRGDKVPPEDERYLMENDPDGYKLAMAMRTPKKKPKKWDSVLDKEDKSSQSGESQEPSPDSSCEESGRSPGAGEGGSPDGGASDSGGE